MQRCLIYLKKLFFSNPYRKSIWFFIILWVLTFFFSDYISYSGVYYLILLIATIVLLLENVELLIVRKLYVKDFYHIFMLSFFCVCFLH